jgi:hypothetical protein
MMTKLRFLPALFVVALPGAVAPGFAQTYDYTQLLNPYTADGTNTVATGINADGMIVGYYSAYNALYNGSGSVGFTLQNGDWTPYNAAGSSLNRTQVYGISGTTLFGTLATSGQQEHKNPSIWFNISGFVEEQPLINDPNADTSDDELGTYVTGFDGTTAVGFYYPNKDTIAGFSLVNGIYAGLDFKPNGVDGSRIVGVGYDVSDPAGYIYEGGIATPYLAPAGWGATVTAFTAISGNLVAGFYNTGAEFAGDPIAYPFLYNLDTDEWTQLNRPSSGVSVYIAGMLGNTIVGEYSFDTGFGLADYAFVASPTAVPEPSTVAVFLVAACALAIVRRRWTRRVG